MWPGTREATCTTATSTSSSSAPTSSSPGPRSPWPGPPMVGVHGRPPTSPGRVAAARPTTSPRSPWTTNPNSPHRDTVYVAWDTTPLAAGGPSSTGVVLSRSTDGGRTFSAPVPRQPNGRRATVRHRRRFLRGTRRHRPRGVERRVGKHGGGEFGERGCIVRASARDLSNERPDLHLHPSGQHAGCAESMPPCPQAHGACTAGLLDRARVHGRGPQSIPRCFSRIRAISVLPVPSGRIFIRRNRS